VLEDVRMSGDVEETRPQGEQREGGVFTPEREELPPELEEEPAEEV